MKQTEKARFLSKVRVSETGCWEWVGAKYSNGYGAFGNQNAQGEWRANCAHRAAYRLFVAPLIDGLEILHSCDNPGCVNPEHLRQGTRKENMEDCKNKGRLAQGEKLSKLTTGQAKFAIESHLPQKEVAQLLGCSQALVSAIRNGKLWGHLGLGKGKVKRHPTPDDILIMLSLSASRDKVATLIGWSPSTIQKIRTAAKSAQPA
jgi:hypothetical protein